MTVWCVLWWRSSAAFDSVEWNCFRSVVPFFWRCVTKSNPLMLFAVPSWVASWIVWVMLCTAGCSRRSRRDKIADDSHWPCGPMWRYCHRFVFWLIANVAPWELFDVYYPLLINTVSRNNGLSNDVVNDERTVLWPQQGQTGCPTKQSRIVLWFAVA